MSTITCLKELNEKDHLEFDDIVIFTVNEQIIEYRVTKKFNKDNLFLFIGNKHNDEIFKILDINKNKIAEKIYEYKPINSENNNFWPETKEDDYNSLTKLVKELYEIIEERKPKYTKYNKFEIMDI